MTCQFSDIFGLPGTGVHSIRIFNIAIIDVFFNMVFAYITKGLFNYWLVLLIWFLIGIIVHKIFCVKTTVDNIIFG